MHIAWPNIGNHIHHHSLNHQRQQSQIHLRSMTWDWFIDVTLIVVHSGTAHSYRHHLGVHHNETRDHGHYYDLLGCLIMLIYILALWTFTPFLGLISLQEGAAGCHIISWLYLKWWCFRPLLCTLISERGTDVGNPPSLTLIDSYTVQCSRVYIPWYILTL